MATRDIRSVLELFVPVGRAVLRMAFEQPGGQAGDGREQYVIEFARTGRAHRHARRCRAGIR